MVSSEPVNLHEAPVVHLLSSVFAGRGDGAYGRVYAATRARGRKPREARAVDLLIAAVALANGLPLFTRNADDFDHLRGLGLELYLV